MIQDCVMNHPLQAIAVSKGMVMTCNRCGAVFAGTTERSKHSCKMNCGAYPMSHKETLAKQKKARKGRRQDLALRQALAVRLTYTIMTSGWLPECHQLLEFKFPRFYVLLQFRQAVSYDKQFAETKSSRRKRSVDDEGSTASGDEGPFEGPFPPVPLTDEMGHAEGEHSVDGVSILCLPYLHRK
jgi:predicted  nucleic acid-binding Zn-ribbon protein